MNKPHKDILASIFCNCLRNLSSSLGVCWVALFKASIRLFASKCRGWSVSYPYDKGNFCWVIQDGVLGFKVSPLICGCWAIWLGSEASTPVHRYWVVWLGFEVSPPIYGCWVIWLGFEVSPPIYGCWVICALGYFTPYIISCSGCHTYQFFPCHYKALG